MAVTTYLQELINQKKALANNLVEKGIEASESEKFNTLVPKVLDIPINVGLPIEVYTEEEMTALLINGGAGSVYKYIGTTGTYENNTLYIRVEPTLETSDGYHVVDSEGSIISLKVTEFIKLILQSDLEEITITENGEYEGEYSKVTVEVPLPQLFAPVISLEGNILSIDDSKNGDFAYIFRLYANGELKEMYDAMSTTTIDLSTLRLEDGTYTITVVATGIDFVDSVASNGVSYMVESDPLKGTWVFNDILVQSDSDIAVEMNFVSNGLSYTTFASVVGRSSDNNVRYRSATTSTLTRAYSYDTDSWLNNNYKTIDITSTYDEVVSGKSDQSDELEASRFLSWLQANATKQ